MKRDTKMKRTAVFRIVAIAISLLMCSVNSFGGDMSTSDILKKVTEKYKTMDTYKAKGTITTDMDMSGMKMKIETSFSILMKKPNLYLISWTQKGMPMPGMIQSGAVWSDGTQPYLYMGVMNAYSKMSSDELALSSATGISGGAALTIPSLFLSTFKDRVTPFSHLRNLKIRKTEKVGKEDCYVISGASTISKKEVFWISKETYLIRKYYRSLDAPSDSKKIPKITDEQLEETIKGMGQEVTEESKKNMREMMESSQKMLSTVKMTGSSIELHVDISSPELAMSDFKYSLPEGTVLKNSLFGEMFGGSKGISEKPSGGNIQ